MSQIDLYNLTASNTSTITGNQEVQQNLELTPSLISTLGQVQGTVTANGQPVQNAAVKIFSLTGTPLYHGTTDANGSFNIPDVPAGSYLITVAKEGYLTPVPIPIVVAITIPTILNLSLSPDPDAGLNIIYGKITNQAPNSTPIANAIVNIYQVGAESNTLIATTKTNSDGQYLFPYLEDGNYIVESTTDGHLVQQSTQVTVSNTVKTSIDLALTHSAQTNFGTVSGFITDSVTKLPIPLAIVALYQIVNDVETLVQITKTNLNGGYLFGNVPDGTFIVKSFSQRDSTIL